jgi:hypothetical protein
MITLEKKQIKFPECQPQHQATGLHRWSQDFNTVSSSSKASVIPSVICELPTRWQVLWDPEMSNIHLLLESLQSKGGD